MIFGRSPDCETLARLGKAIGYRTSVIAPGTDREQFPDVDVLQAESNLGELKITRETFVVVSTQGESDEEALGQAARTNAAYVAFVASKVKAQKVLEYLRDSGVSFERLSQIRAPAGLDLGAASPEEIAVSILAEIVQLKSARGKPILKRNQSAMPIVSPPVQSLPVQNQEARDPVCGMLVKVSAAKYKSKQNGSEIYFCCAGCKRAFDQQPDKYNAFNLRLTILPAITVVRERFRALG